MGKFLRSIFFNSQPPPLSLSLFLSLLSAITGHSEVSDVHSVHQSGDWRSEDKGQR